MFPLSISLYLSSPPIILIIIRSFLSLCLYVIVPSLFFLSSLSHLLSLYVYFMVACFLFLYLSLSLLIYCMISWFLYGSLCLQSPSPLSISLTLSLSIFLSRFQTFWVIVIYRQHPHKKFNPLLFLFFSAKREKNSSEWKNMDFQMEWNCLSMSAASFPGKSFNHFSCPLLLLFLFTIWFISSLKGIKVKIFLPSWESNRGPLALQPSTLSTEL